MKLLPRKIDIDKIKANERKLEIDAGLSLAKSVDALRQTKLTEQKQLQEWRDSSIKAIQQEIDGYIEVKENLRIETEKQEVYRKQLIIPLDKEWAEINQAKIQLSKDKDEIYLSNERLKLDEQKNEQSKIELSNLIIKAKDNEKDTTKAKSEAVALKEMARREFEKAREEHEIQTEVYEQRLLRLSQQEKEYEVALSVISIRENEVKEKESDIIKREQHLESQQKALRVAREVIQKNG